MQRGYCFGFAGRDLRYLRLPSPAVLRATLKRKALNVLHWGHLWLFCNLLEWGNVVVSDPRVNDWFLMSSPFYTLAICLTYAYFVKVIGPKIMENRKPMDLRNVLIVYNFIQVIFSAWLFYEVSSDISYFKNTVERRKKGGKKSKRLFKWWHLLEQMLIAG